jgi:ubiquinone/menaquinone biosynthesis C-methylase UbiE
MAALTYVQFVGTEISPATEAPIDRSVLMAFVELIEGRAVGRVADVGCGPGRVAAFMAEHGLDVVGVDVSQAMLAAARTAHPHIEFVEGQIDALPIETGVLAGAVCWYSVIYTPPELLAEAFGELARVLTPGGYLLLAFQAGSGDSVNAAQADGTQLPLLIPYGGCPVKQVA